MTIKATDTISTTVTNSSWSFTVTITCRVTTLTVSSSSIANVTHLLTASAPLAQVNTPIGVPTITVTPSACSTYTLELVEVSLNAQPTWISGTSVSSTDAALAGQHNMEARISVTSSPYVVIDPKPITIAFTVTLKACALQSILPDATATFTLVYSIHDALLIEKAVPAYIISPSDCGYTSSATLVRTDATTTIPSFLTNLVNTNQKVRIQSSS